MAPADFMPFGFYQRLSPRERVLVLVVAGAVFAFANLFLVSTLVGEFRQLRRSCAEEALELKVQRIFAAEQPKLAQRMNWLRQQQPVLASRDRAGASLLGQIQQYARAGGVLVTNPQIMPLVSVPGESSSAAADYQAVTVEVETQSDWAGVQKFIEAVQQPRNFLVFDLATLRSDTDPAVIHGHFQISKWFAPAH